MFNPKVKGEACLWLYLRKLYELNYFTDQIRHLLIDEFLSWADRRSLMVLPFHCHINVCVLRYFFHTFFLVPLCDNPALLGVSEVAKIWTQGTQHVPPSLDFCSGACPTRIIGEPAMLCCGPHL